MPRILAAASTVITADPSVVSSRSISLTGDTRFYHVLEQRQMPFDTVRFRAGWHLPRHRLLDVPASLASRPARLEDGWVVLDENSCGGYEPMDRDLPYDLADIRRPADALGFTRRYGLLRHGPGQDLAERFAEWEQTAREIAALLRLYDRLRRAYGMSEPVLRDLWEWADRSIYPALRITFPAFERSTTDGDLMRDTSVLVATLLTEGMGDTDIRVLSDAGLVDPQGRRGHPLMIGFAPKCTNLVELAYYTLASDIAARTQLAECPSCARLFRVRHGRQRYCTPRCAGRARARRHSHKQRRTREDTT